MRLVLIDENNFILFIIKNEPKLDEDSITEYLKKVFLNIKNKYGINIYGYYNITIYSDNNYGLIVKIEKEEFEYLSYYENQIEMKIIISDSQVFYKIGDIYEIDKRIIDVSNIYLYEDKLYLELKEKINFILLGNLIENSQIVYENTERIKKQGEIVEIR